VSPPFDTNWISKIGHVAFGESATILGDTRFQLLLSAELVIVLGTSLISPILNSLSGVYDVSPGTIGLMVTAITAPAVVLIPIAGSLADRYGRRPVLIAGLFLFGSGGLSLVFTTDFRAVLVLRGIQGVGYAFTLPTLITTIRDLYTGQQESTGQGLRHATGGIGNAVFPILASVAVVVAWNLPFLLYGLAVLVANGMYTWFDEPTGRNADTVQSGSVDRERSTPATTGQRAYVRQVLGVTIRPHVAAILVARTLFSVVVFAFLTYNSLVVAHVFDGTPALAALQVSLWAGVYFVVSTQAGRITGRWGYTVPLLVLNAGLGIGLVLLAVGPSIHVAGLGIVCIGVGVGLGGGLYRSLISGFAPEALRAGVVSVGEVVGRLGASATPVVLGLVITYLEPDLGTRLSLQWTIGGTGLVIFVVGISCVGLYHVTVPSDDGTVPTS